MKKYIKNFLLIFFNLISIVIALFFAEASSTDYRFTRVIALITGIIALILLRFIKFNNIYKKIITAINVLIFSEVLYYCYLTWILYHD